MTLGASKVLNGKSLDAEEFAFVLTDEGGEQVTATNDVNGMVVFPAIQYGEAGTYQYTIAEVKGDESDVTYDESEYAVTVTVEDNGEGSLVATVAYEGGNAPVFTNTYNAPEAPASPGDGPASVVEALVSGSAKTGDYLLVIAGRGRCGGRCGCCCGRGFPSQEGQARQEVGGNIGTGPASPLSHSAQ